MLNTPKYTIGIQDLAKGRTMLKLVRELEDSNFSVHLQLRAGLDYFSPDLEKAKVQLAAVTALMDDIEPENENSPEIIHVVSYCEAVRLATPPVINESIQITMAALKRYRELRKCGRIENMAYNKELEERCDDLYREAKDAILLLEKAIPNLYTAEGLYKVFEEGFFPVPYMLDPLNKYPNDILIDGKKIAGFLAESEFLGQICKGVIVGCGINLNLEEDELKNIDIPATSIYNETGKNVDKNEFLDKFLSNFEEAYNDFLINGIKGEVLC